ncbi:unnamed protein product [Danaus chrysippus]|uniref:(African queen) hypothetical protein n=1 Tax=Danaus chrysippus TaxID=151541 RepID=A0A8J2VZJ1_9NEOP|nr:unnamed protein product [Danaus chrysippus]
MKRGAHHTCRPACGHLRTERFRTVPGSWAIGELSRLSSRTQVELAVFGCIRTQTDEFGRLSIPASASRVIKKNKKSSFLPETLNMLVSATPNPEDAHALKSESEDEIN